MNPDDFLAHADFVRGLARSLVLDASSADDISQQAWLAALRQPPGGDKPVRAWMSRVVRNLVRLRQRSESRRTERERRAASLDDVPSAEEIVAREEIRRRMIEAVLDLGEPYRSTIILRYYEGLSAAEIARRSDVPAGTVRTRLMRGLNRLRKRLDTDHGGDRKSWCLLIAPLAGIKLAAPASAAATAGASLATGAVAMGVKTKVGIAAALVLGATVTLWHILPSNLGSGMNNDVAGSDGLIAATFSESAQPEQPDSIGFTRPEESFPGFAGEDNRIAIGPDNVLFSGRIVDKDTGMPVPAFHFLLQERGYVVNETVRGDSGRFSFLLNNGGRFKLTVTTSRHLAYTDYELEIPDSGLRDLEVVLDRGESVSGRVVDDFTGQPVDGTMIGYAPSYRPNDRNVGTDFKSILLGEEQTTVHTRADYAGRFFLSGLPDGIHRIVADHEDYSQEWIEIDSGDTGEIAFRLKKGPSIYGRVFDDLGEPLQGALIRLYGRNLIALQRYTKVRDDGTFRTAPLQPGEYEVSVFYYDISRRNDHPFTSEKRNVLLKNRDVEVIFSAALPDYVTWRGTLFDPGGQPAARGKITISRDTTYPWKSGSYLRNRYGTTDESGNFEIFKLLPGRYEVRVQLFRDSKRTQWMNRGIYSFDVPGLVEKDIHCSGATIMGRVLGSNGQGGIINARLAGEQGGGVFSTQFDKEGRFRLAGLRKGSYAVTASEYGYTSSSETVTVQISDENHVRDLLLTFPASGELVINVAGITESEARDSRVCFFRDGESPYMRRDSLRFEIESGFGVRRSMAPGRWNITVSIRNLGFLTRTYVISADRETKLDLNRGELVFDSQPVTVRGRVTDLGGAPVAGIEVVFMVSDVPLLADTLQGRDVQAVTDANGDYSCAGLLPGIWSINVRTQGRPEEGSGWVKKRIIVPQDPSDPFTVNLMIPSGAVTGILANSDTGLPCDMHAGDRSTQEWSGWLINVESDERHYSQSGRGTRFRLPSVPPGEYTLMMDAFGFFKYRSDPFRLAEGQTLDLGQIPLDPCGVMDLEAVDREGKSVKKLDVYSNEVKMRGYFRGKCTIDKLPVGSARIRIAANGFRDSEFSVDLRPGVIEKKRIVLDKR